MTRPGDQIPVRISFTWNSFTWYTGDTPQWGEKVSNLNFETMRTIVLLLVLLIWCAALVAGECPARWYDCLAPDGRRLGSICEQSCYSPTGCIQCDHKPLDTCKRIFGRYPVDEACLAAFEICNVNFWTPRSSWLLWSDYPLSSQLCPNKSIVKNDSLVSFYLRNQTTSR